MTKMTKTKYQPTQDIDDVVDIIVAKNEGVLEEFFQGCASCDYYDGLSHQLYLDRDDDTLLINTEASDNSWLQRGDGSLIQVLRVSGYCDIPADERYTEGCDLYDYGYADWLDMVKDEIKTALTPNP